MLSPYTVLDLTDHRGELAGMILGDLGADVIKIEPPEGSSSRKMEPFLEDAPEPENSLHYFAFNRNKRGITLDLAGEAGRRALVDLAGKADFVIESARPGEMSGLGLGFERLRQANPKIVYVAITAYGQDGPRAELAASDLTLAAMGGPMSLQGHPQRPPVRLSVDQAWLHASAEAVVGALTAHARMIDSGEAQFVDVSAQTAMVWTMLNAMVAHGIQGFDFTRAGSELQTGPVSFRKLYECADGYVVALPIAGALATLVQWCVQDGLMPQAWLSDEDWPAYHLKLLQGEPVAHSVDEVLDPITRFFLTKSKSELLERSLRAGISIAPVNTVEELTRFRQLDDRAYWITAPLPNGQEVQAPGLFAHLTRTPMNVRRWAPRLGEHNEEVLGGMLGYSSAVVASACGSPGN